MTAAAEWAQVAMLLMIFFTLSDLAHPLQRIAAELKRHNDWQEED